MGAALRRAMQEVERADPDTLFRVFADRRVGRPIGGHAALVEHDDPIEVQQMVEVVSHQHDGLLDFSNDLDDELLVAKVAVANILDDHVVAPVVTVVVDVDKSSCRRSTWMYSRLPRGPKRASPRAGRFTEGLRGARAAS